MKRPDKRNVSIPRSSSTGNAWRGSIRTSGLKPGKSRAGTPTGKTKHRSS